MISIFLLITSEFRGNIRHHERRDWMETESALYQLMGVRMNGVMNSITNSDGQYQEIIRVWDARLPAWIFRLQRAAFGKMPAHRNKRKGFRSVIYMYQIMEKGCLQQALFRFLIHSRALVV